MKFVTDDGKEFEKMEEAEKYEKDLKVKRESKEKDKEELENALNNYLKLKKEYEKKYNDFNNGVEVFKVDNFDDLFNHLFMF